MAPSKVLPFQTGDIAATKGTGIGAWLSRKITAPVTDRSHHMLIGEWVKSQNDWRVYESIPSKGVSTCYLFESYSGVDIEVYRLNHPDAAKIGQKVVDTVPLYGRSPYDFFLPVKLVGGALKVWVCQMAHGHSPGRLRAEQLPWARDSRFICTELACRPWADLGYEIVPEGVVPIPSSIKQALVYGTLSLVWKGML